MPSVTCPRCGAPMTKRSGRFGDFWGCSTYPTCKKTLPFVGAREEIERRPFVLDFTPSAHQEAFFAFVRESDRHGLLKAVAGSGKTTTILAALSFTRETDRVAFVAFNKAIAQELKSRAPSHVYVSTLHSLGYANIRSTYSRTKVDDRKVWVIVKDLADRRETWALAIAENHNAIVRLVSLVKNTLSSTDDPSLAFLSDRYDVDTNGSESVIFDIVREALRVSNETTSKIDFDDMIYLCAANTTRESIACRQFDFLFVDETQDLNAAQLEMLVKSIAPGGRVLAVGDPNQSIYGFRGADVNAIPNIVSRLDAVSLPLSVSYRCPKSVVTLAQQIVPQIESAPNAIEGTIEDLSLRVLDRSLKDGDFVLCRRNAPLVSVAYKMLARGVKVVVLGRDIGQGLIALIDKIIYKDHLDNNDMIGFSYALGEYVDREIAKFVAQGRDAKAASLQDKREAIEILSEGKNTLSELKDGIDAIFSDDSTKGIIFSTVHKAKGKEADRVFLLSPDELGSFARCKNDEDRQQELNILYVALTRSKKELYFVR